MSGRRQHTVPRFYLKRFLSPGLVYRRGAREPRRVNSPEGVAVHEDYYGKVSYLDAANSRVEQLGAPSLARFLSPHLEVSIADIKVLSIVVANLWLRSPSQVNSLLYTFTEVARQARRSLPASPPTTEHHEPVSGRPFLVEAGKLGGLAADHGAAHGQWRIGSVPTASFDLGDFESELEVMHAKGGHRLVADPLFALLPRVTRHIERMTLLVYQAPTGYHFVSSDKPVTLVRRSTESRVGAGWANSDALAFVALSPRRSLLMFYGSSPPPLLYRQITPEEVQGMNLSTILNAGEEVYSAFECREARDWMRGEGRWARVSEPG